MARVFVFMVIVFAIVASRSVSASTEVVASRVIWLDSCAGQLTLENASSFRIGDRLFLHQAYGAIVDSVGTPISVGLAGRWCWATIRDIRDDIVVVDRSLPVALDPAYGVQAVKVIVGASTVIDAINVPDLVDGVGGIVVIDVDTFELRGILDARGAGYRGGNASLSALDTSSVLSYARSRSGASGEQGGTCVDHLCSGRLPALSGGGGGNARNAGGGGGAGAGSGGHGGRQTSEFTSLDLGGLGGKPTTMSLSAGSLWFGGGGGGGQQNDFLGGDGGAGGGLVVVNASVIRSIGGRIDVSGADGADAIVDGAGAGGGGGTVVIDADTIIGSLTITARGGHGGDAIGDARCYGPGGGGGGGHVVLNRQSDLVLIDVAGGASGKTSATDVPCSNDTLYGATSGIDGDIIVGRIDDGADGAPCEMPDIIVRSLESNASVGEEAQIIIEVEPLAPLLSAVTVSARVRVRGTVAFPIGPYWWAGRRYTLRIVSAAIPAQSVEIEQRTLRYRCVLGDSSSVIIGLDSVWADNDSTSVGIDREGRLTINGICDAGGSERLFDPFETTPMTYDVFDVLGRWIGTETMLNGVSGFSGPVLHVRRWSNDRGPGP